MSYKPDESILISYIYGELDEKETVKVEQYFQEHPEELKKVQEMVSTRDILGGLKDKEVIAPPVFMDDPKVKPLWQSSYFKVVVSIAASFMLLMVVGRLIGMEIEYNKGELRMSFGSVKQQPVEAPAVAALTANEVQEMIKTSLAKNNESVSASWEDHQKKVDQAISQRLDLNSRKIDDVMKNASAASQEQVRTFVAGLQSDNLRLMKDYLQLSTTEQKKYVETLLVDFSKYLQEQRNQDFNSFQTRINSVEKNTDQFKTETEQILASIISTGNVNKKKNSY